MATNISDSIDVLTKFSGFGSISESAANALRAINHKATGNPIPYNTDSQGLTFFTRPNLNLSYDNLAAVRTLTPFLTTNELTYQRALRVLLDPQGAFKRNVTTPLIDNNNPFITLLSNNLLSLSGWPDWTLDTYLSKPGIKKEQFGYNDSIVPRYQSFNLNASFAGIAGDPITAFFYLYISYIENVLMGTMNPYPESIVEREIDYQTRIYRLILDQSRQFVQKIGACGVAWPTAVNIGSSFNFNSDQYFITDNSTEVQMQFQCLGFEYQDPIIVEEFNCVVSLFNNDMADGTRESAYKKLTKSELNYFNNQKHYPRVNPITFELEWWVSQDLYNEFQNDHKSLTTTG